MNKRLICLCITIFMLFSFVFPLGGYAEEDYFEFIEEEYDEAYIDDYYIDDTFEDESFDTENYADQELWYEDPEAEYSFDTIFEEENIDLNEFGDNLDAAALDSDSEICFNEELFILGETESFATGGPLAIETQPVNWTGVETAFELQRMERLRTVTSGSIRMREASGMIAEVQLRRPLAFLQMAEMATQFIA